MTTFDASATTAQLLDAARSDGEFKLDQSWWGFGGVHGGLALGMLTAAMGASMPGRTLQQVSGQFRRPLREGFSLRVSEPLGGKTVTWLNGEAAEGERVAVSVQAVFAVASAGTFAVVAAPVPSAPPPEQCPEFVIPPAFAPFSRRTEIRPVGPARPFSGQNLPELMAWVRIVDDDLPPDAARLVVLMDALAPSYAAVLRQPVAIPSVTFTVSPGAGLADVRSPWLLLRARTDVCRPNGWLVERLDAWTPDGVHVGTAEQLRMVMALA